MFPFLALFVGGVLIQEAAVAAAELAAIKNLAGEPDYRQVRLHWEVDQQDPDAEYQIRYCELQTWGSQRCRLQAVTEPDGNDVFVEDNARLYSAEIRGLRMATTYSFEVKKAKETKEQGAREDRAEGDDKNENMIVIPTKGFSAKATQCLPHASEIEVSTGPFFGGRIAVEAADGERCALDGEPDSPRDTYTLRINHTECGSRVNETTVATFVLVQENLPILTHSTRRFLVLCSYQPETLTVRAGINLPSGHSGRANFDALPFEEQEDNQLGRRGRSFRGPGGRLILQRAEALVKDEENEPVAKTSTTRSNAVPIIVIAMLSIAGVIGLIAIALKFTSKRILRELDNISIASDISSSSCSTVSETENHPHSRVVHI